MNFPFAIVGQCSLSSYLLTDLLKSHSVSSDAYEDTFTLTVTPKIKHSKSHSVDSHDSRADEDQNQISEETVFEEYSEISHKYPVSKCRGHVHHGNLKLKTIFYIFVTM